jgi:alternate signal-mediated exported protein
MKKATKGALAAAAAGSLLLGGAGSLAYWTDAKTVTGASVNGGSLSLGTLSCSWTVSHSGGTAASFDPGTGFLVPGDQATETCTGTIAAKGANLVADLSVADAGDSGTLGSPLTVTKAFKVGGATQTTITGADDGKALTATVVVDFPIGTGADNSTNGGKTVSVGNYVITATQAH